MRASQQFVSRVFRGASVLVENPGLVKAYIKVQSARSWALFVAANSDTGSVPSPDNVDERITYKEFEKKTHHEGMERARRFFTYAGLVVGVAYAVDNESKKRRSDAVTTMMVAGALGAAGALTGRYLHFALPVAAVSAAVLVPWKVLRHYRSRE